MGSGGSHICVTKELHLKLKKITQLVFILQS